MLPICKNLRPLFDIPAHHESISRDSFMGRAKVYEEALDDYKGNAKSYLFRNTFLMHVNRGMGIGAVLNWPVRLFLGEGTKQIAWNRTFGASFGHSELIQDHGRVAGFVNEIGVRAIYCGTSFAGLLGWATGSSGVGDCIGYLFVAWPIALVAVISSYLAGAASLLTQGVLIAGVAMLSACYGVVAATYVAFSPGGDFAAAV